MKNRFFIEKWLPGLVFFVFLNLTVIAAQQEKINFEDKFPIELSDNTGTRSELIVYLTGDGGWNRFSRNFVHEFEKQGYGVVALNSFEYFRKEKSPSDLAAVIGLISTHYLNEWNKTSLIIVGYSFGADVASFLPANLSSQLKRKVKKVALLSPSASTDFVVRISDLLGFGDNETGKYKTRQEIEESKLPVVCIFGKKESLLLKKSLINNDLVSVYELPGGHQFNDNFNGLVQIITS